METVKKLQKLNELSKQGTCLEFFSAYQEMDIDRMMSLCDQDGKVAFMPLGEQGQGTIGTFGKTLWLTLMDCFPDLDNTVTSSVVEADGSVTCQVKIFGTQAKDFAGIPSQGLRFESDHIFIFHFDAEDKINRVQVNWNHENFQKQLGL